MATRKSETVDDKSLKPQGIEITRTYQGRVTSVIGSSIDKLFEHHSIFQDAVNYYLFALAAMDQEENERSFSSQVKRCWEPFERAGNRYRGIRASIAPYLGLKEIESFEEAKGLLFAGDTETGNDRYSIFNLIIEKLDGDGAIQKGGRSILPMLCAPDFKGTFLGSDGEALKDAGKAVIRKLMYHPKAESQLNRFVETLKVGHFAKPFPGTLAGANLREYLEQGIELFQSELLESQKQALSQALDDLDSDAEWVKGNPAGPEKLLRKRLFGFAIFSLLAPTDWMFKLLRSTVIPPQKEITDDFEDLLRSLTPVASPLARVFERARGLRGVIFPAFTALAPWKSHILSPRWVELDICAFKEAITSLNQFADRTKERLEKHEKVREWIDYSEGRTEKRPNVSDLDPGEEGGIRIPRLVADERFGQFEQLLQTELAVDVDGEKFPYSVRERTIRGFNHLKKRWQEIVDAGGGEKELFDAIALHQQEHFYDVGAVTLFRKLALVEHWKFWKNDTNSRNVFLDDYLRYSEKKIELHHLEEPIRFTCADIRHSPRFQRLSDVTGEYKPRFLSYRAGVCEVECGFAGWEDVHSLKIEKHKIRFSAPRLLRDGLIPFASGDEFRWLPPVLLPFSGESPAPDKAEYPLVFSPHVSRDGMCAVHLNIPVTIVVPQAPHASGNAQRFKSLQRKLKPGDVPSAYLKWREDKKSKSWWKETTPFFLLSVDQGQKFCAATALLKVSLESSKRNGERSVGIDEEGKEWFARVMSTSALRLPGEDCQVYSSSKVQVERWGSAGRSPTDEETMEALQIFDQLSLIFPLKGIDQRRNNLSSNCSFPEQNDELLRLIRGVLGAISGLQRCKSLLRDGKLNAARDGVIPFGLGEYTKGDGNPAQLEQAISRAVDSRMAVIEAKLQIVTNRILPLKKEEWVISRRGAQDSDGICLDKRPLYAGTRRRKGQRGLSFARLEQIALLRRLYQSLQMRIVLRARDIRRLERGEVNPDPCPEILEKLNEIREQRAKQTANLILAEALGVRLINGSKTKSDRDRISDRHGRYERIPGREPVAFVVMEKLGGYGFSQGRGRRENRRLMDWCHRQVTHKVRQLLEPFQIPVLEVNPRDSSQHCSRTGARGFRAKELRLSDFDKPFWQRELQGKNAENVLRLKEVLEEGQNLLDEQRKIGRPFTVLAPDLGGSLFISLKDETGQPVNADINAAVNIGLRSIGEPGKVDIDRRFYSKWEKGKIVPSRESDRDKIRFKADAAIIGEVLGSVILDPEGVARRVDSNVNQGSINGVPVVPLNSLRKAVERLSWNRCHAINNLRLLAARERKEKVGNW